MSNGVESRWYIPNSSVESVVLKTCQKKDVHYQKPNLTSSFVTHQSMSAQIKVPTDTVLRQVERLSGMFAEKKDLNLSENNETEASDLHQNEASSSLDNWYDKDQDEKSSKKQGQKYRKNYSRHNAFTYSSAFPSKRSIPFFIW